MEIKKLLDYTGELLQVERFKDYCPNGLQVEGKPDIEVIVSGVTASMALLEAAADFKADLILVHHGYFWRNEDARIKSLKRTRLKFLLQRDLNLAAYHLPLDAHPVLGNNAQLGQIMGVAVDGMEGEPAIIAHGVLAQPMRLQAFGNHLQCLLTRAPLLLGDADKPIRRIAWCTGAAQDYFEQAIDMQVDAYISGEVSEQTFHLAQESGVAYIAAGHHATERYGIQSLGHHLSEKFGLQHFFIDIDNPI